MAEFQFLEQVVGRLAEHDRDLGVAHRQTLAVPQVERHPVPTPVVDPQTGRDERLGLALGVDPVFLAVALVLRSYRVGGIDGPDRPQQLRRLVPERLCLQGAGRFHGKEREHLEHVVLQQVADRAGLVVVGGATGDVDVLGDRQLHVLDRVSVPDALPQRVREPEHHQVLHRLLAQVVVDAEQLRLVEGLVDDLGEARARTPASGRTASRPPGPNPACWRRCRRSPS